MIAKIFDTEHGQVLVRKTTVHRLIIGTAPALQVSCQLFEDENFDAIAEEENVYTHVTGRNTAFDQFDQAEAEKRIVRAFEDHADALEIMLSTSESMAGKDPEEAAAEGKAVQDRINAAAPKMKGDDA